MSEICNICNEITGVELTCDECSMKICNNCIDDNIFDCSECNGRFCYICSIYISKCSMCDDDFCDACYIIDESGYKICDNCCNCK